MFAFVVADLEMKKDKNKKEQSKKTETQKKLQRHLQLGQRVCRTMCARAQRTRQRRAEADAGRAGQRKRKRSFFERPSWQSVGGDESSQAKRWKLGARRFLKNTSPCFSEACIT